MTTFDTERLAMADGYIAELRAFTAQLRKFHANEPDYIEWADFLDDATNNFSGSFKAIRQEMDDAEQSDAHAEMMADIAWHNGRV
jgi:hypothetical protein